MPTKAVRRFTAWSYSRLRDWRACPAQAKWKHLDKPHDPKTGEVIREMENAAMKRGGDVHSESEAYIGGEVKKLPERLKLFTDEFVQLRAAKKKGTEEQWAFDREWQTCRWDDWDRAWLRIKVDAWTMATSKLLRVIDVKTGKMRGGYDEQLKIYAVGSFARFERVEKTQTELWFTDAGEIVERVYPRDDYMKMREAIERTVEPMMQDTLFSPTPGPQCRWCIFAKDRAGICKFSSNGA